MASQICRRALRNRTFMSSPLTFFANPNLRTLSSSATAPITATLFPGDGIGPDIANSVKQGGQLANYIGVVGLAKAKGLAVPITFQKAYETSFHTRMIHKVADRVKQLEIPNAKVAGHWESRSSYSNKAAETTNQANSLPPLSPHKPQLNSTPPILNRVSATYLTITLASSYLLYVNLGLACFSLETFYQLGYSSKLTLISIEMAALALTYHTISGFNNIVADYSGRRLER